MNRISIDIDWMLFANDYPDLAELIFREPKFFIALARSQLSVQWTAELVPPETIRIWIRPFGIPLANMLYEGPYQTQFLTRFHGKVIFFIYPQSNRMIKSHERFIFILTGTGDGVNTSSYLVQVVTHFFSKKIRFDFKLLHKSLRTLNLHVLTSRFVKCTSPACHQGSAPFLSIYDEDGDACKYCGGFSLVEDRTKRIQYNSRFIAVSPLATIVENGHCDKRRQFRRTMIVELRDDLSERDIKLGDELILIGVMVMNPEGTLQTTLTKLPGIGISQQWYLDAYSMQVISAKEVFSAYAAALPTTIIYSHKQSVSEYESVFVRCTEQIESAAELLIPDLPYFFKLKIGILISAVSGNHGALGSGRENVHILCKGGHQEVVGMLFRTLSAAACPIPTSWISMSESGEIIPRFSVTDRDNWVLEASQICQSNGGLCFIPHLYALKKPQEAAALVSVMDSQHIVVGRDTCTKIVQCKTSVIARYNPDSTDIMFSNQKEGSPLQSIARHFDLVVDLLEQPDKSLDRSIARAMFMNGTNIEEGCRCLTERLLHSSSLDVTISLSARNLLTAFYQTGRQAMRSDMKGGQFYQLESLTRVSKAFAKLRLSEICEIPDAVFGIAFIEETRAAKMLPTLLKFELRPNGISQTCKPFSLQSFGFLSSNIPFILFRSRKCTSFSSKSWSGYGTAL